MRYVVSDARPLTLAELRDGVGRDDGRYRWEIDGVEAALHCGDVLVARIELNTPSDGLFDEERAELIEFASEVQAPGRSRVLKVLSGARAIVAAQVLFGTGDAVSTWRCWIPSGRGYSRIARVYCRRTARATTMRAGAFSRCRNRIPARM